MIWFVLWYLCGIIGGCLFAYDRYKNYYCYDGDVKLSTIILILVQGFFGPIVMITGYLECKDHGNVPKIISKLNLVLIEKKNK